MHRLDFVRFKRLPAAASIPIPLCFHASSLYLFPFVIDS